MLEFELGQVVATPGAIAALSVAGKTAEELIARHLACDWGDLNETDRAANDAALIIGARIFSVYELQPDEKVWVITEAVNDSGIRESTCILLPSEY